MYFEILRGSFQLCLLAWGSVLVSCAEPEFIVAEENKSIVVNVKAPDGDQLPQLPTRPSYVEELDQLRQEMERQKLEIAIVRDELAAVRSTTGTTGTSYTRWGRKTCNGDTQALYSGYAAGAHNSHNGSGSNLLCLHDTPQWHSSGSHRGISGVYGVEVELYYHNRIFSYENNGGRSVSDHPGPCAVCYVPRRHVTLMIPARTDCPAGWTREFHGYVLADGNFERRRRTSYVCWDRAPQSAVGSVNQNQGVLYPVEIKCGTLPCSSFVDGSELTCVVCSK